MSWRDETARGGAGHDRSGAARRDLRRPGRFGGLERAAVAASCSSLVNAVTTGGAAGDGQTDDTDGIQRTITMAYEQGACVYLPPGVYRITRDLDWTRPASIIGNAGSAAVLYSPDNKALADTVYGNQWDRAPLVDNVVFDGLRIDLNGPYKSGLAIKRSVFVNRIAPGETPTGGGSNTFTTAQVAAKLSNLRESQVTDSIFLSDRPVDGGTPVYTYRTTGVTVSGNLIGADLSSLGWLSRWPGSRSWTQPPAARLDQLRAHRPAERAGPPPARRCVPARPEPHRERQHRDPRPAEPGQERSCALRMGFRWPDSQGQLGAGLATVRRRGLKVRNGTTATIAGNHLDGTAVLLYTYAATNVPEVFQDVVVCGNVYDIRNVTAGSDHSGIQYWRNFAGTDVERSIAVFGNRFIDPAAGQPGQPDISQSAATRTPSASTTTPIPTGPRCRWSECAPPRPPPSSKPVAPGSPPLRCKCLNTPVDAAARADLRPTRRVTAGCRAARTISFPRPGGWGAGPPRGTRRPRTPS
ncbi:glycosyl hydrolase family 28-related protein [Actinomadura luteofluorescens]|uniref:glycosyl hydrolase family 28-related protein n=1 Tax=Actinomadura luteofluorescens TaxID=46163 RepID=UPI0036399CD4